MFYNLSTHQNPDFKCYKYYWKFGQILLNNSHMHKKIPTKPFEQHLFQYNLDSIRNQLKMLKMSKVQSAMVMEVHASFDLEYKLWNLHRMVPQAVSVTHTSLLRRISASIEQWFSCA